jgi:hypothetical protein
MASTEKPISRKEIPFFDGINSLVSDNISKKEELNHAENIRSEKIGSIEKRKGYRRLGNALSSPTNYGMAFFDDSNASSVGFYRVTKVGSTTSIYYLNTSSVWTALSDAGTGFTGADAFFTKAEKNLFMVNGTDANRYVQVNGTTVVTSATATGHLYNSPIANKIAYYKDRLYVGDYKVGATQYPTSVMMSSKPLGILSLVDGDHASGVTTVNVTDTKYIQSSDTLQVYRGGSLITTLTVTGKTQDSLTVSATGAALNSADELWVNSSYAGTRYFRWADNPESGIDAKQYDTFKLTGAGDESLTALETIGDYLLIANKYNIGVWNDYNLKMFDLGIGCCSERGYVKTLGLMFFLDYNGIYATNGGEPKLMSSKIEEYIKGATKAGKEAAAMGKKGKSIFCSIGDVTLYKTDGSVKKTLSDVVLEYNLRQENWYVHTGIKAGQFETYIGSLDVDRLEFSDSDTGKINELFYNTYYDDADTTDVEIPINIETGNITLAKRFENFCYPKKIVVDVESGSQLKAFISMDDEDFIPIEGVGNKGAAIFKVTPISDDHGLPRCRKVNIAFREISGRRLKISKIAIEYIESTEDDSDSDTNET